MSRWWPWARQPAPRDALPAVVQRDIAKVLAAAGALRGLGRDDGLAIARLMRLREARPGTVLAREAQAGSALLRVVLEGEARIERTPGPLDTPAAGLARRGAVFGEQGLLEAGARCATVIALTPMRLAVLDRGDLEQLVTHAPRTACALLGAMLHAAGEHLQDADRRLRVFSGMQRAWQEIDAPQPAAAAPAAPHGAGELRGLGVPIV